MRKRTLAVLAAVPVALAVLAGSAHAQNAQPASSAAADGIQWGPAPAVFPAGAQLAVLAGDPGKDGEYTVRLRMPNGYRIAPHTHPTDENVTVIQGTFEVGMGGKYDASALHALPAGGFVVAPANQAHFAAARGVTIVQVHGMGPFALTYVNPADMPKAAASGR